VLRIAIVNDLRLAVEALRRTVLSVPGHEIAWVAVNGLEAVEKCAADLPDLILMDLIMPVMDGVRATDLIIKRTPCAILVVTATVSGNAGLVFEAMGCGALDAVATPVFGEGGRLEGAGELLHKIATIAKLLGRDEPAVSRSARAAAESPSQGGRRGAIGASTGGPRALAEILKGLPAGLDAAVAIVQHVDLQFVYGLVDWLAEQTPLPVKLAEEGERPEPGRVYVAGTNDHLVVGPDQAFHYTPEPRDYPFRPSVDAFFHSLATEWALPGTAALLTGMGRDGARGLLALRRAGWRTIVQDESTSVVYGMPRAAVEIGAAAEILPLRQIGGRIIASLQ